MYSKIQIYGNCDIDYIWSKHNTLSSDEQSSLESNGISDINWSTDTVALSNFNENVNGNSMVQYADIQKYIVQRREVGTNIITDVVVTEGLSVNDWACQSTKSYEYFITPVYLEEGKEKFGSRITTPSVHIDWDRFSIVDLIPTSIKGRYIANENNVWTFALNIEEPTFTTNNAITHINTYGRFPKEHRGKSNYITTTITALIGDVLCNGDYGEDNISKIENFRNFCNNGNLKLFKDIKGNVIPCSIRANTDRYSMKSIQHETTISFDIVQLADRKDISVYSEGA